MRDCGERPSIVRHQGARHGTTDLGVRPALTTPIALCVPRETGRSVVESDLLALRLTIRRMGFGFLLRKGLAEK
jgi:hypothetical protein